MQMTLWSSQEAARALLIEAEKKIELESASSYIFIHLLLCFVLCTRCEFRKINTGNPHYAIFTVITTVISIYCAPRWAVTGGLEFSCVAAASQIFRKNAKVGSRSLLLYHAVIAGNR